MDWSGRRITGAARATRGVAPVSAYLDWLSTGRATLIAELIAVALHPELAKETVDHPPLYLFLANFISLVLLACLRYEYHVVLAQVTAGAYSIKPLRAAWFRLIPIYGLYWVFKWPRDWPICEQSPRTLLMRPIERG